MIDIRSIAAYRGPSLSRGPDHLYLAPHPALAPYIANYTITFPSLGGMPEGYTILPTASATLCYSVGESRMEAGLRGVNTRAEVVGGHANRFAFLLLIEFHSGGLFPILGIPQSELADVSLPLRELAGPLHRQVSETLETASDIDALKRGLDAIFLARYADSDANPYVVSAMRRIRAGHGAVSSRGLSQALFLSERQLGRIFRERVGTGIKTFSRIVRVHHALDLMQSSGFQAASVAAEAGYFDQPHFVHDFRALCGITPQAYRERMSIFYKDTFKL